MADNDNRIRLTEDLKKELIRQAINKLPNSYAPYSHYNVAAAALMSSGKIYTGVNVESSLLGNTICAERNAIFHAVTEGERKLVAIAVVGGPNTSTAEKLAQMAYCYPCGACRQLMIDFAKPAELTIICAKSPDDYREHTLAELLPWSWNIETENA